jgi:hypothetical protein
MHLGAAIPAGSVQVKAIQGLQSGKGEADGTGIDFRTTKVNLVAPLPNAVVRDAVGPADVINQVLNEGDLDRTPNQVNASGNHLSQG